ncbi:DivIVA domain-containing protein [Nesterenkonia muleiensis]|uniref:DivIVA domain-containing protein n=1 Tax=Nesterenkonia muleiensis TaxID=2282648 RepID=UPI000E71AA7D|nr:DivIVA domain-containing protein [Nesterenkonia muleiensis]
MIWLYVIAVVVVGVVVVLLTGRWEGAEAPRDESPAAVPDRIDELLSQAAQRELSADDLQQVHFDSAVRGYRMEQVDKLLEALTLQLHRAQSANSSGKSKNSDEDDISAE